MKIYKNKSVSKKYRILLLLIVCTAILIVLSSIITKTISIAGITGCFIAFTAVISVKNRHARYVGLNNSQLVLMCNSEKNIEYQDVYDLNTIRKIDFIKNTWYNGGGYSIMVFKHNSLYSEVKEVGAMGMFEINELCRDLHNRGIDADITYKWKS